MLPTRYSPFRRSPPAHCCAALPLDLHVLGLPLAFILSQDQTLHRIISANICDIRSYVCPSGPAFIVARNNPRSELTLFVLGTCLYFHFCPVFSMNFPRHGRTAIRSLPKRDCKDKPFFRNAKIFSDFFRPFLNFFRLPRLFSGFSCLPRAFPRPAGGLQGPQGTRRSRGAPRTGRTAARYMKLSRNIFQSHTQMRTKQ